MTNGARQVLTFRLADRELALGADQVAEVARPLGLTRVPGSPRALAGLASHRGQVLPVLSLGEALGMDAGEGGRVIVLRGAPGLGLIVDAVTGFAAQDQIAADDLIEGPSGTGALDALMQRAFEGVAAPPRREMVRPAQRTKTDSAGAQIKLLSLKIGDQRYALPLADVVQVLTAPQSLVSLPRTDDAMLGVFSWRDDLIPAVSARVLLGLAPKLATSSDRVVVTKIGAALLGLVVDNVDAVIATGPEAIGPVPSLLNRDAGEARIDAMLRTAAGHLVSILSPQRLLRQDTVHQLLQEQVTPADPARVDIPEHSAATESFLLFNLGGERYGVGLERVEEVVGLPSALTRAPGGPSFLLGMMNLRGAVIPVIDQGRMLGAGAGRAGEGARIVVMRLEGLLCGFVIEGGCSLIAAPLGAIGPSPGIALEGRALFERTLRLAEDVVLVVDPDAMLDKAERELLASLVPGKGWNLA